MKVFGLLFGVALGAAGLPAAAQTEGPQLQKAIITGHGNVLTIRRLPVRSAAGTVYRDITIELQLDPSGAIRADAAGSPLTAPIQAGGGVGAPVVITRELSIGRVTDTQAAPEVAARFVPGVYRDDAAGGLVRLISEGRRIMQEFPTYSLSAIGGDTPVSAAEWYAGPIRTNPRKGLIRQAGIDSNTYSYGVVTSGGGGHFDQGLLVGAVQAGDRLTLVSFHLRGCCTYAPTPTSQITYTRVGD